MTTYVVLSALRLTVPVYLDTVDADAKIAVVCCRGP